MTGGNVAKIAPEHRRLVAPTELRQFAGWLCWRSEQHEGEPKPRKVPYYSTGGRRYGKQGSENDRSKLVTFAAARDAAARLGMDGVGLAMLPDWGITALDFDHCVDADGNVPPEIAEIATQTYAEYSPSGQGIRAFVRGDFGDRKSHADATRYGMETFHAKGFVTFTGNVLSLCDIMGAHDTIARLDREVGALCEQRWGSAVAMVPLGPDDDPFIGLEKPLGLSVERMEELLSALDPDCGREEWVRVGLALHHECEGDDTGFELWDEWSSQGGKYPGDEALRYQWESFGQRTGERRRQVTMASVIKMANAAISSVDLSSLQRVSEAAAVQATREGVSTPLTFEGKFPIHSPAALAGRPPMDWWIKGVLPQADLVMLYGASGSGKSFVVLDLIAAIALGREWQGHKVRKGRTLYVAAEGGAGVGKRLEALAKHLDTPLADLDLGVITVPPNILNGDDIEELVKAVASAGGFDLIVLDTYAQVTPGANENASEDMGKALSNCNALRQATGATIILIHHAGKDASKGARGWSGNKAAVDAEIEVSRHEDGQREIKLTKLKDGEDGLKWGFKLKVVDLAFDSDGDPITSCVIEYCDPPAAKTEEQPSKNVQRMGRMERHVLEVIESEYQSTPSENFYALLDRCVTLMPAPQDGERDTRRFSLSRAIQSLAKRKEPLVALEHGRVIFLT